MDNNNRLAIIKVKYFPEQPMLAKLQPPKPNTAEENEASHIETINAINISQINKLLTFKINL